MALNGVAAAAKIWQLAHHLAAGNIGESEASSLKAEEILKNSGENLSVRQAAIMVSEEEASENRESGAISK